jgi:hypothetical protein
VRREIGAERLLDDHAAEAFRLVEQPGVSERVDERAEEARRGRKVEHDIAAELAGQRLERLGVREIALQVVDLVADPIPA